MAKTIVGLFSSMAEAEKVKQTLSTQGYTNEHITVMANDDSDTDRSDITGTSYGAGISSSASTGSGTNTGSGTGAGIGDKISNFFSKLTGGDDDVHHHYASGVNSGGALLAVTVPDEEAQQVAAVLKQYGARDIDGAYEGAATSGVPVYGGSATSTAGETAIPVVEEELVVGKREVERGGVRVYSHVTERPVSADVTLREEFINVERRPVNRVATAADFAAGRGPVVELTATGEEAVVGKSARVVEEVLVGKGETQRTEAIQDSVRRTEVEVEQIPTTETSGVGSTTSAGTVGTLDKDRF